MLAGGLLESVLAVPTVLYLVQIRPQQRQTSDLARRGKVQFRVEVWGLRAEVMLGVTLENNPLRTSEGPLGNSEGELHEEKWRLQQGLQVRDWGMTHDGVRVLPTKESCGTGATLTSRRQLSLCLFHADPIRPAGRPHCPKIDDNTKLIPVLIAISESQRGKHRRVKLPAHAVS